MKCTACQEYEKDNFVLNDIQNFSSCLFYKQGCIFFPIFSGSPVFYHLENQIRKNFPLNKVENFCLGIFSLKTLNVCGNICFHEFFFF